MNKNIKRCSNIYLENSSFNVLIYIECCMNTNTDNYLELVNELKQAKLTVDEHS